MRVRAPVRVRRAGLPDGGSGADRTRRRPVAVRAGPPSCAGSWRLLMSEPEADRGIAPVLEVAGLRKEFGSLVAVDDVSFAIPPGAVAGDRRRVRFRQDDDRADDRRPGAPDQRDDHRVRRATGPGRPGRRGTGGGAAARSRSSSRIPTPASIRGRRPSEPSTRSCGCIMAGPRTSAGRGSTS